MSEGADKHKYWYEGKAALDEVHTPSLPQTYFKIIIFNYKL